MQRTSRVTLLVLLEESTLNTTSTALSAQLLPPEHTGTSLSTSSTRQARRPNKSSDAWMMGALWHPVYMRRLAHMHPVRSRVHVHKHECLWLAVRYAQDLLIYSYYLSLQREIVLWNSLMEYLALSIHDVLKLCKHSFPVDFDNR